LEKHIVTEHVDEDTAQKCIADFYKAYGKRGYGLVELIAFSIEWGYSLCQKNSIETVKTTVL
jgi:hypothetical protein